MTHAKGFIGMVVTQKSKKNGNLQKILRQFLFYELLLIKGFVVALLLYKLIMSALLNDFALFENQNTRSIFNC